MYAKSTAWYALDTGLNPDKALVPEDRAQRTAFRVARAAVRAMLAAGVDLDDGPMRREAAA